MRRNVGRNDAAAGKLSTTIIPDELLNSLGQLANETITVTGISTESILNLLKLLRAKPSSRVFNRLKKFLDFAGEGIGTILTTTILPILPRNPKDPVDGFLQVNESDHDDTTTTRTTIMGYITVPIPQLLTTTLGEHNATMSRKKGAHKSAKAAEVEAVGATGQGGEAGIACEGRCGGVGRLDVVEEISDVVVTKGVE
ncbi:YbfB/YjiJ family MFS transporter [Babesia caballi]|uniref:YbfB/YjiJ family MFS transporter n=1 Tax=Babesia caballi TaxID=5871 RepID=A0AAV4M2I8_BABCB|nr:YbfB/YjiJ family MFS transporter [Babesia caballi]